MDENFEKILDLYPIPENYNVARDDEKVEVSKKKKTTVRRLWFYNQIKILIIKRKIIQKK